LKMRIWGAPHISIFIIRKNYHCTLRSLISSPTKYLLLKIYSIIDVIQRYKLHKRVFSSWQQNIRTDTLADEVFHYSEQRVPWFPC
jgi:hypothetical protein